MKKEDYKNIIDDKFNSPSTDTLTFRYQAEYKCDGWQLVSKGKWYIPGWKKTKLGRVKVIGYKFNQ